MNPAFLTPNDQIRIVSPSGHINPSFIDGATAVLSSWGLQVTEGEFSRSEFGRFAGTVQQRLQDLQAALNDPAVKAIICSRGGYGVAQLVDKIDFTEFLKFPKWLIGFSDITILHNAISNLGVASIHGIMAKHLTELNHDFEPVFRLREMLAGVLPTYTFTSHPQNRNGIATGKLIGGNLSVLMGMRGSQFDLNFSGAILFIEDIAEKPYHIDRMMQNLRFSGVLAQLSGLVVGQFSDCEEDPFMMQTITEIILGAAKDYDFPICFDFPAGHVDYNLPIIIGADVKLEVSDKIARLMF